MRGESAVQRPWSCGVDLLPGCRLNGGAQLGDELPLALAAAVEPDPFEGPQLAVGHLERPVTVGR